MDRQHVMSSNLRSVGYDPASLTLEIEFHSGGLYQYLNVPSSVYSSLMSAPSKGTYFDYYIKKARYKFIKIR